MGAVRTHTKQKMGRSCPSEILVLFRDRMVTNCLMKLKGLYYSFRQMSKGKLPLASNAIKLVCHCEPVRRLVWQSASFA